MKATSALVFFGLLALAAAGPVQQPEAASGDEEIYRGRRSHYGPAAPLSGGYTIPAPAYYSPCAGASAHLPYLVGPQALHAGYGHAGYGHASPYGLNAYGLHYRANGDFDDSDILMDMQRAADQQAAMARTYGYEVPAAGHAAGALAPVSGPLASGPAVGVFPRGHAGGCNVPLLLSCAPSIVAGQMVHTKPHYGTYGGYGGSLYRGADDAAGKEASAEESHKAMGPMAHDVQEEAHSGQGAHSQQAAHAPHGSHAAAAPASTGAQHNTNNMMAQQ